MKLHSLSFVIGIIGSIILGFGIVAGVWLSLRSVSGLGSNPNVLQATKTGPDSATLSLSTFPDSMVCHGDNGGDNPAWVSYCPSTSFEVPPNSTITMIIKNYDGSSDLHNDFFRQVRGTVGGIEMINNKPTSQVQIDQVAHTFTLQSPPNADYPIFVSVPIVGVADNAPTPVNINGNSYPTPNTISFQFRTGPSGNYIWHCYDPCGSGLQGANEGFGGPMSTLGYMAGNIKVVSY